MLKIQKNVNLAQYSTFKIGGPAKYFAEVGDEGELYEALDYAKGNKLEVFVLGGGSNILVSDGGFNGLVIKLKENKAVQLLEGKRIKCWAGTVLAEVVNFCIKNSLAGLEWAAGIPGTLGGAIRGNAGTPLGCMADNIESVEARIMASGENRSFSKNSCNFEYRSSIFKENKDLIIVSAVLKLAEGNQEEVSAKIKEIIQKRSKSIHPNPKEPSSGSFFKNPEVADAKLIARFEKDAGQKIIDGKIPAGWLIDEVGLRGKMIGGAQVSEKHANFMVNTGKATAEDVIMLSGIIKQKVRQEFAVELREEVEYVGF